MAVNQLTRSEWHSDAHLFLIRISWGLHDGIGILLTVIFFVTCCAQNMVISIYILFARTLKYGSYSVELSGPHDAVMSNFVRHFGFGLSGQSFNFLWWFNFMVLKKLNYMKQQESVRYK